MLEVIIPLLVLAQAQGQGFPLEDRLRWTYERENASPVAVEVAGTKIVGGKEVSVLSVVGEWLFSDRGGTIYVSSKDGGFVLHGSPYREPYDPPLVYVQSNLEVDEIWHSETVGRTEYRDRRMAFDATVLGRETVTVPAGEFDAWKIAVANEQGAAASRRDFTAWFVPGIGFIKYEYRYNSYPWRGYLFDSPMVWRLKEFGKRAYGYPIEYPKLSDHEQKQAEELAANLKTDDAEVRRAAEESLVRLGPGVIPALLEALQRKGEEQLQVRVERLLQAFAPIEISGTANQARGKVGHTLPVEFRIRNVGCAPIPVLPALDASDRGWRYPSYIVEVRDPEGRLLNVKPGARCGNVNPLRERKFAILQPGEELDPFPSPGIHYMLWWWKPERPGVYTIRCIYDGGGIDPETTGHPYSRWSMSELTPTLVSMIQRTPRGRVVSNEVSLTIEE